MAPIRISGAGCGPNPVLQKRGGYEKPCIRCPAPIGPQPPSAPRPGGQDQGSNSNSK